MKTPEIKVGGQAMLDLTRWVEIVDVEGGYASVVDQEGEELEVCVSRLDPI